MSESQDNVDQGQAAGADAGQAADSGQPAAGGGTGGMVSSARDIIERTLLLGVGAASLTVDRLQLVADDFVKRGQLTSKEGREMVESLAGRSRSEAKTALGRVDSTLQSAYHEVGLATRREVEDVEFRLRQLEHRLSLIERQLDASSGQETA